MADEPKKEEPKLKGQAIIEDLKVKLKEIDKQADAVIKDIAQQAENYKADPSSVSGRVDVSKLEEILQRADSIIYDPKVAEVVDDARNAKAVKYIVNGLHDKVRRSIQHDLVEKYPDLKLGIRGHAVEGTGTYYRQDSSKEETFGGVFSEFVVKNIDESRLNYENKRLSLIKAIPFYARVKQNPEYKGIGQDFQNIRKVALSEKSILDTIFDKMAEYKEQDVATIISTARKNHHKPSELSNAYRVFATYAKNFRGKSGFPDENIEVDQNSREKALEKLLNGDPKRESNIPKDLIPVIRALSIQYAYAYSIDANGPDGATRKQILDKLQITGNALKKCDAMEIISEVNTIIGKDLSVKKGNFEHVKIGALKARINRIPHLSNTVLKLFPEFSRALEQMQMQSSSYESRDAFLYVDSFVTRYENHEFDSAIAEADHYAEAYRILDEKAATPLPDGTTPENGNQVFQKMADQQQEIVNRQIDTLARRRRYAAAQERLSTLSVKKSDTELDLENLGKTYGVALTGSINYSNKDYLKKAKEYNEATPNDKKFMREDLLDELSITDYEALRDKAIADMRDGPENKYLVPQGTLISRLRDTLVTAVGRLFRIRNINTDRERHINDYIKSHYLGPMLAENATIQKDHDTVATLGPKIKEDDIYFKDVDRARAARNKEREADKSKAKAEPAKPAKPEGERT